MIDFRYHLVSIVAVFLALTVGLVLGTTMLQDPLLDTLKSETALLRGQSEDLRLERDEADRLTAGADQFVEAAADEVLADRLRGIDVVVVAAPDTDEEIVHALERRAEGAGAKITGELWLQESFLDEAGSTFVDELALQVSSDPQELDGGPYAKAGAELGRALAAAVEDEDTGGADSEDGGERGAGAVLAAFEEGGLITVQGSPARSADAMLVVAPAGAAETDEDAVTVLRELIESLSRQVGPTVLAGDVEAGREGGLLARVLADEVPVSTVDVAGRAAGDVATVLVLAEALDGARGAYGVGEGTSGFVPRPLPGPIEDERDGDQAPEAGAEAAGGRDEARRAAPGDSE